MSASPLPFLPSGQFRVGCNYWASHAGAHMWSDWRPESIAADFAQLAEERLTLLRVFPLWPDFQPLHRLCTGENKPLEYRFGESPLPDDPIGQAGVSAVMLDRFRTLADEAQRNGIQLIVGLITGWMSGRMFTPPAFANLNVITDPEALRWQARFVRCFVENLRDHPAIAAWDLGNECNVMGPADAAQAWIWTHTLSTAIRAADPSRPVVSGLHSTPADPTHAWSMHDQGELTDFLTTHPYPIWTPHCDQDPANTLRPQLHSTAESLLYSGVGGKPCFAEETGTMGPFIIADDLAPQFLRPVLFSLWAHDCRAMLWWCAYDQEHLQKAPYDWVFVEQELGLHRSDRAPKPHIPAIRGFSEMLASLPFTTLPPRVSEAVCLLSPEQDQWGVAQSTYLLSALAGVDVSFAWGNDPLRDSAVYLMPSAASTRPILRYRWVELLARIEAGATLYLSLDTTVFGGLESVFGVEVSTRSRRAGAGEMTFTEGGHRLPLPAGGFDLALHPKRAEVLARDETGNPVFTRCTLGKGQVFLLTTPVERIISDVPGAFTAESPYGATWQIYAQIFAPQLAQRVWKKTTPEVAVTEHPEDDRTRIVVLVNHRPADVVEPIVLAPGWRVSAILHGTGAGENGLAIPASDGAILRVERV